MTIRKNKFPVIDIIKPKHVLLSVFDKEGLDMIVTGLRGFNPEVMFYSTGGTGERVLEILGENAERNYTSVEDFTRSPEMEGGLVKTLHPKIHAGLLGERGNPKHEKYLRDEMREMTGTPGVFFDVCVVSLYPFGKVLEGDDCTPEEARVNIDIGGSTMLSAAAKYLFPTPLPIPTRDLGKAYKTVFEVIIPPILIASCAASIISITGSLFFLIVI